MFNLGGIDEDEPDYWIYELTRQEEQKQRLANVWGMEWLEPVKDVMKITLKSLAPNKPIGRQMGAFYINMTPQEFLDGLENKTLEITQDMFDYLTNFAHMKEHAAATIQTAERSGMATEATTIQDVLTTPTQPAMTEREIEQMGTVIEHAEKTGDLRGMFFIGTGGGAATEAEAKAHIQEVLSTEGISVIQKEFKPVVDPIISEAVIQAIKDAKPNEGIEEIQTNAQVIATSRVENAILSGAIPNANREDAIIYTSALIGNIFNVNPITVGVGIQSSIYVYNKLMPILARMSANQNTIAGRTASAIIDRTDKIMRLINNPKAAGIFSNVILAGIITSNVIVPTAYWLMEMWDGNPPQSEQLTIVDAYNAMKKVNNVLPAFKGGSGNQSSIDSAYIAQAQGNIQRASRTQYNVRANRSAAVLRPLLSNIRIII